MDGDLHVVATTSAYYPEPPPVYTWPAGLRLRDYFNEVLEEEGPEPIGISNLLSGSDAVHLRAMREAYLTDTQPGKPFFYGANGIPMTDGTTTAQVFMRDALPYEDEQGLWHAPGD